MPRVAAEHFVAIAAGGAHSMALTVHGECFGWGRNEHGETGVCDTHMDEILPEALPSRLAHSVRHLVMSRPTRACGLARLCACTLCTRTMCTYTMCT